MPASTDRARVVLVVNGREVPVTNPDRVLWPRTGTTKQDLIAYLLAVAPVLLPQLRDRATMLWRFPEGVDGPGWFQAQCRGRPPWVATHDIVGRRGETLQYCVIEEPATLVWLANLGTIELHPHGWTTARPTEPFSVVFDLDPGPPAGLPEACRVALRVRDRLRALGIEPVVKTSGASGIHVAARVAAGTTFAAAKAFARRVAEDLAAERPAEVVATSDRARRPGRVYVDWVENDRNRQLVAAYSPRARAEPRVSTPVAWEEVAGAASGDIQPIRPSFAGVLARVARYGDLWLTDASPAARLPPA